MTIISTDILPDSRGNHPGRVVTEFETLNYMQYTVMVKRLTFYPRETLSTPLGNCVLTALGWALKSLQLMRWLDPLLLCTTDFSSLIHLRELLMDWHYMTASAFDPTLNILTRTNLGQLLPLSLKFHTITDDGKVGEPSWYCTITNDHQHAITHQLAGLLWTRAATHYTTPLHINMDDFTAYRGAQWMFDLGGGHAHCADWIESITWKREMAVALGRPDEDGAVIAGGVENWC
jgi:hypothetical protein